MEGFLKFIFTFQIVLILPVINCFCPRKCNNVKNDLINIHLIAHSHIDPGWVKTFQEYYSGSHRNITFSSVQSIFLSVFHNLKLNQHRKFTLVEACYLKLFLKDFPQYINEIQHLIKNGQIEIVMGGWVMNDEACTLYHDIINQMTLGLNYYKDIFGECGVPEVGWQIDTFGHSATQADLMSQFGFSGVFWGRVSDSVKEVRGFTESMEFWWDPKPTFENSYLQKYGNSELFDVQHSNSGIFVSILPNLYQPPQGFCFDIVCRDEPIFDDPNTTDYNVPFKIAYFFQHMESQALYYDTNQLIVTMGNDFNYQVAETWFDNMDKLIYYANLYKGLNGSTQKFNVFYSTPGCYLQAIHRSKSKNKVFDAFQNNSLTRKKRVLPANATKKTKLHSSHVSKSVLGQDYPHSEITTKNTYHTRTDQSDMQVVVKQKHSTYWPSKISGDFLPLINSEFKYWSGFFTSRPTFKWMCRESSRILKIGKQIDALAALHSHRENEKIYTIQKNSSRGSVNTEVGCRLLEELVALVQHHDAITGTSRQVVINDYTMKLHQGMSSCMKSIEHHLKTLNVIKPQQELKWCAYLNVSLCGVTQIQPEFTTIIYNPLSWEYNATIVLPVTPGEYLIEASGKRIDHQMAPIPRSLHSFARAEMNNFQNSSFQISFKAALKPLQFATFDIKKITAMPMSSFNFDNKIKQILIENQNVYDPNFTIENEIYSIQFDSTSKQMRLLQNKKTGITTKLKTNYFWYGQSEKEFFGSGAYLFRANSYQPNNISQSISSQQTAIDLKIIKGVLYQQARQKFADWLYLETTLYQNVDYIELSWTVGPIPMEDEIPKDVIIRFDTDIQSIERPLERNYIDNRRNKLITKERLYNRFYTDSNGRFLMPRRVPQPKDGMLNPPEYYYPINSRIVIRDNLAMPSKYNGALNKIKRQFGLINDRSQGGSSLRNGQLEIMVHRRSISDDKLGMGEPLDELDSDGLGLRARGKFYVVFDEVKRCNEIMVKLAQQIYLSPMIVFVEPDRNHDLQLKVTNLNRMGLLNFTTFPTNLNLLTFERWKLANQLLLRIEHLYSPGEHDKFSRPATYNLENLFKPGFVINNVIETSLGANLQSTELKKLHWQTNGINFKQPKTMGNISHSNSFSIYPLEIKTFLISYDN